MAERSATRPWTDQEDALLREGVAKQGEPGDWKNIASFVPGRDNKSCRKRWLHSLSPSLKKSAWTPEEDQRLLSLYEQCGPKWSAIAREIPGRTDDACSKRYREALDPRLKKDPWTPAEDQQLLEAYERHGTLWSIIGQELGRSGLSCRNRWRLQERNRKTGRAQPYASPRVKLVPPPLDPSTSLGSASSQVSELPTPPPNISVQLEPQDTQAWGAPYYPPESYPIPKSSGTFKLFGQQLEQSPTHATPVPPRQFSSASSLSAALGSTSPASFIASSAPIASRPLPEDNFVDYGQITQHQYSHSQPTSQTTSPLFFSNHTMPLNDTMLALGDYGMESLGHQQRDSNLLHIEIPQGPAVQLQTAPSFLSFPSHSFQNGSQDTMSPISPSVMLPMDALSFGSPFFSPFLSGPFQEYSQSPAPTHISSAVSENLDELSSTNSSPCDVSASISPATPSSEMPIAELPLSLSDISTIGTSPTSGGSLLFAETEMPQAPTRRQRPARGSTNIRLSSTLKLSENPEVRPYACGHPSCWSNETLTSQACFQTSRELCDHHRDSHADLDGHDKLFRCGLKDCDKAWKSVNGLQYHLQVSSVHFKVAVQNRYASDSLQKQSLASAEDAETTQAEDSRGRYLCKEPGCFKVYKQPSGLRYHRKNGHKHKDFQFEGVPPALERELPNITRKMCFRMDGGDPSASSSGSPSPGGVDNGSTSLSSPVPVPQ